MTPPAMLGLVLSLICIVENVRAADTVDDKKFNHAYVLQDLEAYQTPSTPHETNNVVETQNTNNNVDKGSYYVFSTTQQPSTVYNSNPYLSRPAPNALNSLPQATQAPATLPPVQATPQPPVVHTAPVSGYETETPVVTNNNVYGPHLYSVQASQYTGPQLALTDLLSSPVIILVKNPTTLSYDMAYASSGLNNLDRDTNSQMMAKLLLRHSDKVGVLYPTNGFPINSFPDFPIGNLILPQDMNLSKIFNFYPRYVPILFLYSATGYHKVARETSLTHLGQYKYE